MGEKKEVKKVKETPKTKTETNSKKGIVICSVIAAVLVIAIVVALVVLVNNGVIGGKKIAGKYELIGMRDGEQEYTQEDISMLKTFGVTVSLQLKEDNTGTIDIYGQTMELTYDKENMTYNGVAVPYTVDKDTITLEDEESRMVFQKVVEK